MTTTEILFIIAALWYVVGMLVGWFFGKTVHVMSFDEEAFDIIEKRILQDLEKKYLLRKKRGRNAP